ncbi:hypothetical protein AB0M29_11600 [Streptomyces sp. NPDC051976]|uniref:hypothetical protein n=1 Tax=Streptomyces sp. NPDC051976 TaxID=3154947 RepID=UPI003417863E
MGGMEEFKDKAGDLANKAKGARGQGAKGERAARPREREGMDPMESMEPMEDGSQQQRRPGMADRDRNRAQQQEMDPQDDSASDWS